MTMIALVFDTETDGLVDNHIIELDKQASVIEYYGVVVNLKTGKKLGELECMMKPHKYPMSDYTIKVTKTQLSNAMLSDCLLFGSYAEEIKQQIEGASAVIAHNLSFDMEIIDLQFERLGQKIKWPRKRICTVEQTAHLLGYRMNLTALHMHLFDKEFKDAHRARADVEALVRICRELYKREVIA
jgi:DNA polymerase III epsilon subunit-like protein